MREFSWLEVGASSNILHFAILHNSTELKNEFFGWQGSEVKRETTVIHSKMRASLLTSQNIRTRKQGKVIGRVEATGMILSFDVC
jgi:hypothetical protein